MNKLHFSAALLSALVFTSACGAGSDNEPRQETLDHARVLGIASSPVVSEIPDAGVSKTVSLIVYAAVPLGQEAAITARSATGATVVAPENLAVGNISYEEHPGFRLVKIELAAPVPEKSAFPEQVAATTGSTTGETSTGSTTGDTTTIQQQTNTGGDVAYSFTFASADTEEVVDGNFLAWSTGSSQLSWSAPTVTVDAPAGASTVDAKDTTIRLSHSSPQSEQYIVGWYVSAGQLDDRRAEETRWIPGKNGSYSVIGTVRGTQSRGFGITVVDVEAD